MYGLDGHWIDPNARHSWKSIECIFFKWALVNKEECTTECIKMGWALTIYFCKEDSRDTFVLLNILLDTLYMSPVEIFKNTKYNFMFHNSWPLPILFANGLFHGVSKKIIIEEHRWWNAKNLHMSLGEISLIMLNETSLSMLTIYAIIRWPTRTILYGWNFFL